MVKASHFGVSYPGAVSRALNRISIEIQRGESAVVTGPSGCGKSTLALAITGFIPHAVYADMEGDLIVGGMNPCSASVYDVAQWVGLVQQDPEGQFCTARVEDEVAFGPENLRCSPEEVQGRVAWALDASGAGHLRGRLLAELSGGEKQRIAIAAVLAMRPRLLILDEPTANLDPRATGNLLRLLRKLQGDSGLSMMILEHKPSRFLGVSQRMIRLEDGVVVFDGPPGTDDGAPRGGGALGRDGGPGEGGALGRNGAPREGGAVLLSVSGISQRYGSTAVLHEVDLQVRRGEIVGIMGDNGSGKTTLLLTMMGLLKPTAGRIRLNGQDITSMPVSARAKHIGMVFQNPNHQLFADRVWRETIISPVSQGISEADCRPSAEALLDRFGLAGFRDRHPLTLSFGQKRRLNLAAAMISDPDLLLLDEPFVGQDSARACDLIRLLADLAASGKGIVLVGHDPDAMAACCHRLVFMERGRASVDAPVRDALKELQRRGEDDYVPLSWQG
ncbi:MAG: ABC transporter ATP-binding protein [Clostridia bacterium]|nr:ABC transporter ATP-binding protein [Clostridia bacterium]